MSQYIALFFAFSLILQSLLSFPLVFLLLQIHAIKGGGNLAFPLAFIFGILLDVFYFKSLGTIAIFFLAFLFAIFTYKRKFETDNLTFIFISSFIGSMILFLIVGESQILVKSFLSGIVALLISKVW